MRLSPALVLLLACLAAPGPARAADPDPWLGADKALHFGVSAGLAGLAYGGAALVFDDTGLRLGVGASVALTAGVGKELVDLAGYGTASFKDLAWDALGTAAGLLLAWGIDWLVHRLRAPTPNATRQPSSPPPAPPAPDSPFIFVVSPLGGR